MGLSSIPPPRRTVAGIRAISLAASRHPLPSTRRGPGCTTARRTRGCSAKSPSSSAFDRYPQGVDVVTAARGPLTDSTAPPPQIGSESPRGGVLGLLPDLGRDALGLLTSVTRDYGDLVHIRLGLTPVVVVGHPALVEEVLVTRNHDYRKSESTR